MSGAAPKTAVAQMHEVKIAVPKTVVAVDEMKVIAPKKILESCLLGARNSHPLEFVALLAGKLKPGEARVKKLYLAPLASAYETGVLFDLLNVPLSAGVIGTFHSHPVGAALPSKQDLRMFAKTGAIHLIAARPYTRACTNAFAGSGRRVDLQTI